jgi:hypothetical protein
MLQPTFKNPPYTSTGRRVTAGAMPTLSTQADTITPSIDSTSWRSLRVDPELCSEMDTIYADDATALDQARYAFRPT